MTNVHATALPDGVLLSRYMADGCFMDCYSADIPVDVSHEQFVVAFYTTRLFKLERFILKLAVSRPSTDEQVVALAAAELSDFAAWSVEDRRTNELLMCDFQGRTRSWLMTENIVSNGASHTRLYFGSAVVPVQNKRTGEKDLGTVFRLLLPFHKRYSVALLSSAVSSLLKAH